jgi:putative DNA primase/helicase
MVVATDTAALCAIWPRAEIEAPPEPKVAERPPLTEHGNAERFAKAMDSLILYCHRLRRWFIWDGKRWAPDVSLEVERFAGVTIRGMLTEALLESDDKTRRAIVAWQLKSETAAMIRRIVELARLDKRLQVRADGLDADPMLFNVANGTLNLLTGELQKHFALDYLTKCSPVEYDPEATCPTWDAALQRIFAGRRDVIEYLARWVGYALTGSTAEHALLLCWGTGANGKSTIVETIKYIFGDYSMQADFSTFLASKNPGIRNDIARLHGARLVTVVESEINHAIAESVVKHLTGGDTVAARFLYPEHFEFRPAFKIWMATNHRPKIRGTDGAIWRRIKLLPYTVQIPPAERDKDLADKLKLEAPGILAWAVRGLAQWREQGLSDPQAVVTATADYKSEEDLLRAFLDDACLIDPEAVTTSADLYMAYTKWADESGERSMSSKALGAALRERDFVATRNTKARSWKGIALRQCEAEKLFRR